MKIFKDRQSAGKLLAKRLTHFTDDRRVIVLGIPRGGVVVATEVAKQLHLPLDIMVIRKIGAPFQPELALGAVDPDGQVVWEEALLQETGVSIENLTETIDREKEELVRRESLYRQNQLPLKVDDKTVILVDDGIATGSTMLSAIKFLRRHAAKKIILAVPVASREIEQKLSGMVDELIILETPQYFQAVGQFYQNFEEVSDQEVIQLLKE